MGLEEFDSESGRMYEKKGGWCLLSFEGVHPDLYHQARELEDRFIDVFDALAPMVKIAISSGTIRQGMTDPIILKLLRDCALTVAGDQLLRDWEEFLLWNSYWWSDEPELVRNRERSKFNYHGIEEEQFSEARQIESELIRFRSDLIWRLQLLTDFQLFHPLIGRVLWSFGDGEEEADLYLRWYWLFKQTLKE